MIRRIEPVFVERVWGRTDLSPLFGPQEKRIGEVWFPLDGYPLLVKFIFTDERLSIQVHPDDEYAARHENSRGKTEMWHILSAEEGSTIALGLKKAVSKEALRDSIADGSVVDLMEWVPVKAGDSLFASAGTIHAIGGGISLCEIQQNSDVTYRLFDYNRPRELHLEKGLEVSDTTPYEGRREYPVSCEHFTTELIQTPAAVNGTGDYLLIPIAGSGTLAGQPFEAGQCWFVSGDEGPVKVEASSEARLLRTGCA